MNRYIVTIGKEYWPALNSVWAVLKEGAFDPEMIYVLGERRDDDEMKKFLSDLKTLLDSYETHDDLETIMYDDIRSLPEKLDQILDGDDGRTAIDITGGPRELLTTLLVSRGEDFNRVFYLSVKDGDENDRPYPSIPRSKTEILDFKEMCEERPTAKRAEREEMK